MRRLALVLPVVMVVACGGGTSGGLSKADYLKQAEAICANANDDQKAVKTPTAVTDLAPYVAKILALADSATKAIGALEPPKTDKADLDAKVLTPLKGQLAAGHVYSDQVAAAAAKNDQAALIKLLSSPPSGSKADLAWMRSYGFVECVNSADTEN